MDDLKKPAEVDELERTADDAGAGFVGEAGFGAGVFYLYACVNCALLTKNLKGEAALAGTTCVALAEAAATVSPGGKQASFASRARAHYVLAERGDAQPRTLAAAFLKPVEANDEDQMAASIERLQRLRDDMDQAYGACAEDRCEMLLGGTTRLADILHFCRKTCA